MHLSRVIVKVAVLSGIALPLEAEDGLHALDARVCELCSAGCFTEAIPLARQTLELTDARFGEKSVESAAVATSLGLIYDNLGLYDLAEPLFERAAAIRETSLGPDDPDTATSLNNLALCHHKQGRHERAEPLYKRALAIREKSLAPDAPHTGTTLNDLAMLYSSQGRYDLAEPLHERSLAISEKTFGPDHPETATSLNNLALLHGWQGRFNQAEPLFKRALAINEKVLGPDHPDTATGLNNLAAVYEAQGEYGKAEPLYQRTLTIREKALGPDHPDVATGLNNLGLLYESQGKYALAEPLLRRAVSICEKSLGPDHPDTVGSLNSLAALEYVLGRFPDAGAIADRARRGTRRHMARVLSSLPAAEQEVFMRKQYEGEFHGALSLGLFQKESPPIASLSAGWLANGKAVGQEASAQRIILTRQSETPATAAVVGALTQVRAELTGLALMTPSPKQAPACRERIAELQTEEHRLIHEIGGQLATLDRDEPWVEIDEIRKAIPADGVLVDIARFEIYDFAASQKDKRWQPARYAAWITPPAGAGDVTIVDLGDAAEIDGLVADYRRAIERRLVDLSVARPLAERVLRPILAALPSGGEKVEELILSPDGALWLVPWQALPLDDGAFAIERYAIRTVTSGRDLVPLPADAAPRAEPSAPLIVADPAFDEPPADGVGVDASAADDSLPNSAGRVLAKVEPLPATRREAEAARAAVAGLAGVAPAVRLGREATAAAVLREAIRPKLLVLATHGFFLPDQKVEHDERQILANARGIAGARPLDAASGKPVEDPLLRCGLLFTGANLPAANLQADDGVLTGAEIVGLDLAGTDLVVLSACETGVGRVDVGEGVAGLRQAFQIAGAKSVVATLWQVPDEESSEIMAAFYANLAKGQPPAKALRSAQLAFIAARRDDGGNAAAHPHLWAAYGTTGR